MNLYYNTKDIRILLKILMRFLKVKGKLYQFTQAFVVEHKYWVLTRDERVIIQEKKGIDMIIEYISIRAKHMKAHIVYNLIDIMLDYDFSIDNGYFTTKEIKQLEKEWRYFIDKKIKFIYE